MLDQVIRQYLKVFPGDAPQVELLLNQLKDDERLNDRRNFRGHIAGDAIILSPDHKKILLIYHKRSKRWQQPGGHWEEDEDGPWLTAEREAYEETGVRFASRVNLVEDERVPLQIYRGPVAPSKEKEEPRHWHHDFRYGFIAATEELGEIQDDGIKAAKWVDVNSEFHDDLALAAKRLQALC